MALFELNLANSAKIWTFFGEVLAGTMKRGVLKRERELKALPDGQYN